MPSKLAVAAVASLGALALLACGFLGAFGVEVYSWRPSGPVQRYWRVQLLVDGGQVVCRTQRAAAAAVFGPGPPDGLHAGPIGTVDPGRFRWERALWAVNADAMPPVGPVHGFVLAVPVLPLVVMGGIAPLLWCRRRPDGAGFEVSVSERQPPS